MKNYMTSGNYLDDWFDAFVRPVAYSEKFSPMKTDIKEENGNYIMEIEIPGFKKEDINLELNNGKLIVSAAKEFKEESKGDKKDNYIRRERCSRVSREYFVGEDIVEEDIKAKYDNGILEITFPKDKPKQIPEKKKIEIF